MAEQVNFLVSKWYADVVDEATGNAAILYHSELTWKKLKLRFSNQLQFTGQQKLQSSASFTSYREPVWHDNQLHIHDSQVNAVWQSSAPCLTEKLLENESGHILWECIMPIAQGKVHFRNGEQYSGLGYAERLTFSVKPWEMPIKVLHWGRFLAEHHAIVWIRWEGLAERNLIFYNGQKYTDGIVTEELLHFGTYQLRLKDKYTLRNGSLITTVFRRFTWLKKLFPEGILNLQECKWQTHGQLYKNEHLITTGWAIHEKVEWI